MHWRRRSRRRHRGSIPKPVARNEVRRGHSDCATTNDHHGGGLDRSMPSQYQAETSDQLPPRSSRITSQIVKLTPCKVARKQPMVLPSLHLRAAICVIALPLPRKLSAAECSRRDGTLTL